MVQQTKISPPLSTNSFNFEQTFLNTLPYTT
nr:MAG TPA: hypothetical protein [Caudoviricetes sp.]